MEEGGREDGLKADRFGRRDQEVAFEDLVALFVLAGDAHRVALAFRVGAHADDGVLVAINMVEPFAVGAQAGLLKLQDREKLARIHEAQLDRSLRFPVERGGGTIAAPATGGRFLFGHLHEEAAVAPPHRRFELEAQGRAVAFAIGVVERDPSLVAVGGRCCGCAVGWVTHGHSPLISHSVSFSGPVSRYGLRTACLPPGHRPLRSPARHLPALLPVPRSPRGPVQ